MTRKELILSLVNTAEKLNKAGENTDALATVIKLWTPTQAADVFGFKGRCPTCEAENEMPVFEGDTLLESYCGVCGQSLTWYDK